LTESFVTITSIRFGTLAVIVDNRLHRDMTITAMAYHCKKAAYRAKTKQPYKKQYCHLLPYHNYHILPVLRTKVNTVHANTAISPEETPSRANRTSFIGPNKKLQIPNTCLPSASSQD
jgi:hypothetical protein